MELPLAAVCVWLSLHTQELTERRIVLLMRRIVLLMRRRGRTAGMVTGDR